MYNTYLMANDFNVGIYIRLSQEDKDKKYESDSESVINQKELLRGYVKNNNFNLVKEYVDDGYSGTDFERPGFQSMLEDINNKKINNKKILSNDNIQKDEIEETIKSFHVSDETKEMFRNFREHRKKKNKTLKEIKR